MGYVTVTGGKEAIVSANRLIRFYRLKDAAVPLDVKEIQSQMRLMIDRVMGEGGLYAPEYAAIALKQAEGDIAEAAFLLRAYRSTLPRSHYSLTVEPAQMRLIRRISSAFKDIPGGQMLGPTYDYTHRLIDFALTNENEDDIAAFIKDFRQEMDDAEQMPTFSKVIDVLRSEDLMDGMPESHAEATPFDVTMESLSFPAPRSARLQLLARGETGAMVALAYSSMRGYGAVHPTIGELRVGFVSVYIPYPFSDQAEGMPIYIGEILLTEVEIINSFAENKTADKARFSMGYGLCFGHNEPKAIAMAILESSLETQGTAPVQDQEFVLMHIDSVEANGFVSHLKLPHYVTFQSSLDRIRQTRNQPGKEEIDVIADRREV
ncbi:carbon-phosphorus lyase complex subunit PhnI [Mahella sp.]|uniref:carbon-phosphorus lyase complex subunit PhnI n=1 Tax=Mahella sp. TaxID=2798721 RepID=UPI0025C66345|nr:carbon-phosphorus lyase complex subunit PhnI [Mahella sp.]MBZ4665415.1 hypothetical protein [Mahella sp.]